MNSEDDFDKSAKIGSVPNKRRLRLGLSKEGYEKLVGQNIFGPSLKSKKTHPDWIKVDCAKQIFSQRIQRFYGSRYPNSKIIVDDSNKVNVMFLCEKVIHVSFRVQFDGAEWPKDTLVIANIHKERCLENSDPYMELLSFIASAQKEVGYFYVGLEYPSGHERQLIKRFGFDETGELVNRWSVSVVTLIELIEAEIKTNHGLK
ncbi:hypothetical protein [Pseudomonas mandelii]|uniref:hypothetical protein n=1 Tax=Pseudomonas mandelii TaxID=75612 RepID=UPI003D083C29